MVAGPEIDDLRRRVAALEAQLSGERLARLEVGVQQAGNRAFLAVCCVAGVVVGDFLSGLLF